MTPGQEFYAAAMMPARMMQVCFQRGDGAGALNAVHYNSLAAAFHAGVQRIVHRSGLPRERVVALIPENETHAAALATMGAHAEACAVFSQHQSSLAGSLLRLGGAILEVHFNILGSGLGDALASSANSWLQDARMQQPLGDLVSGLNAYDRWLGWCANVFDTDEALRAAYRATMWRRRIAWLVVLSVLFALAMVAWRSADQWWPF